MISKKIGIWEEREYCYPGSYGFTPFMACYLHEDTRRRPAVVIAPGGAYRYVSPSEADLPAMEFYRSGYQVFVLAYTVNYMNEPLRMQPLHDIARTVRLLRKRAEKYCLIEENIAVCGFSAGAHLCASLCVHHSDVGDPSHVYDGISARPDAAILCYPVITSGRYANRESFRALLGENPDKKERDYMSLEKHVTKDTPPCFLWQTAEDPSVPVENSYLFARACRRAGVPFAHHVFPRGVHGMSVATEDWLERNYGCPYTMEQICFLTRAVREGRTALPREDADRILRKHGLDGTREEKWSPLEKEKIREDMQQVTVWRELAKNWLLQIFQAGKP